MTDKPKYTIEDRNRAFNEWKSFNRVTILNNKHALEIEAAWKKYCYIRDQLLDEKKMTQKQIPITHIYDENDLG